MKFWSGLFSVIFSLVTGMAVAVEVPDDSDVAYVWREIQAAQSQSLPVVSDFVAGYRRPDSDVVVIVGDFTEHGEIPAGLGKVIGRMMRWNLAYEIDLPVISPAYFYERDGVVGKGISNASATVTRVVAKRWDADFAATGDVYSEHGKVRMEIVLWNRQWQQIDVLRWSGAPQMLPAAIADMTLEVAKKSGYSLSSPGYLHAANATSMSQECMVLAAGIESSLSGMNAEGKRSVWARNCQTPLTLADYMRGRMDNESDTDYSRRIELLAENFPDNPGIGEVLLRSLPDGNGASQARRLERVNTLLAGNPHNLGFMLFAADLFAGMGYYPESLAVTREVMERAPGVYRGWWCLGYVLREFAWSIRGNHYVSKVESNAMDTFSALMRVALRANDVAIKMNPDMASLWALRISLLLGYSSESWEAFMKGLDADSQEKWLYFNILNFSQPKWGGAVSVEKKAFGLAERNLKDEQWLDYLASKYPDAVPIGYRIRRALGIPLLIPGVGSNGQLIGMSLVLIFLVGGARLLQRRS